MIYHKIEQRSEAWYLMRLGIPTASEFHKIVTPTGKLSAQSAGYMHTLLAELMLARPLDDYQSEYMIRGQELEDSAIDAYEFQTGAETLPGGFITTDSGLIGCSPDRLVSSDGILEIKCPAPNTHVGYLLSREVDGEKKPQLQGQLLVTVRDWVDVMSHHPEMPPVIVRVKRDEEYITKLRDALERFCGALIEARCKLEQLYGKFPDIVMPSDRPAAPDTLGVSDDDVDVIWQAAKDAAEGVPQ